MSAGTRGPIGDRSGAPGWFDAVVLVAAVGLAAAGLAGLGLALLGVFSWWSVLVVALAGWGSAVWAMRAGLARLWRSPATRSRHLAAATALGLGVLAAAWYGAAPSQHLLVERDPGAYATTSVWVAEQGSLVDRDVLAPFGGVPGVVAGSPGSYLTERGLEFQFDHFTSSAGAAAHALGGHRALFRLTGWVVVLGLLAVYAVTARVTGRPWWALVAPVVLGASLPVVVVARDMYSEPYLLALLWATVLLLAECWRRPSRGLAAVAGVLSGALLSVRIDALLHLTALGVLVAATWVLGDGPRRRLVVPYVAGAVPAAALGVVDFVWFTGGYPEVIGREVVTAAVLLAGTVSLAVAALWTWSRRAGLRDALRRRRGALAAVAAGSVATVLLGMWLVRPLLPADRLDVERWGILGAIQAREGDPVDPFRSYYELSVRWIEWYVGPLVVAAGIVGLAWMTWRLVRGTLGPSGILVLALFATGGMAYLAAPGINPDQLWATRRLVPVALVVVVVAAVVAIAWAMDRLEPRRGAVGALGCIAALAAVVPTVVATAPIALVSEQPAMWGALGDVCEQVGADGAVAVVGVPARDLLPMALRARCGVPVAELDTGDLALAVEHARELEQVLADGGRRLTLVGMDEADLAPFAAAGLGTARRAASTTNPREHEHTLNRRPERYLRGEETFFLPREIVIWTLPVGSQ